MVSQGPIVLAGGQTRLFHGGHDRTHWVHACAVYRTGRTARTAATEHCTQKACADAERRWQLTTCEHKAAEKVRADTVAPVRDKIALEGEIESLKQVLFEDTNKMVATERMRHTEAQCEVRGGHFETATLGFARAAAVCMRAEVPEQSVMQSIGGGTVGGGADRRERMSASQMRAPAVRVGQKIVFFWPSSPTMCDDLIAYDRGIEHLWDVGQMRMFAVVVQPSSGGLRQLSNHGPKRSCDDVSKVPLKSLLAKHMHLKHVAVACISSCPQCSTASVSTLGRAFTRNWASFEIWLHSMKKVWASWLKCVDRQTGRSEFEFPIRVNYPKKAISLSPGKNDLIKCPVA
ncbi:hypothetical protein K438DRAFT_1935967 [Mycena galopus ATCC 62051]|nr:hypothetical protein K438DRAFT_1935967 [Mycena galopus ATCC 62051]